MFYHTQIPQLPNYNFKVNKYKKKKKKKRFDDNYSDDS